MDRILQNLASAVSEEDEASRKLWEARRRTQTVMEENVVELSRMGVLKISVNKRILNAHLRVPLEKR